MFVCCNDAFRKIFHYSHWELVKQLQYTLMELSSAFLSLYRKFIDNVYVKFTLHNLGIGCRQNSSNCDRQCYLDVNSRLICSAWLT